MTKQGSYWNYHDIHVPTDLWYNLVSNRNHSHPIIVTGKLTIRANKVIMLHHAQIYLKSFTLSNAV
jgi:hypothetical protein